MKLSIITINYNNVSGLRKTMESVFAQTCKDFEYIVVDGASTDGSVGVIHEFDSLNAQRSTLNAFTWVSEKDTGIYNAMNKGIEIASGVRMVDSFNRSQRSENKNKGVRAAKGEYVLMLNSGDYFVDEHVMGRILPELDGTDIIQGNTISEYPDGLFRNRGYGRSDISFFDVMDGNFLHQASFIKKSIHDMYGLYDDSYRKGGDSYFYWKTLGFGNASFRYVDIDVANFDLSGISNNPKWKQIDREEDDRWYRENFPIRLQQLYKDAPRKIKLYDTLHTNRLIWYITMLLVKIANVLNPPMPKVKTEKIEA